MARTFWAWGWKDTRGLMEKIGASLHLGVGITGGLKLGGIFSRDRKYGEPVPWLTVDGSLGMGSEDYLAVSTTEAWNVLKTKVSIGPHAMSTPSSSLHPLRLPLFS